MKKDYFKTYSNNMFYILGILSARGTFTSDDHLRLSIQKTDKYIMKKISELVDILIEETTGSYNIVFDDKDMIADILSFGSVPYKGAMHFPNVLKAYLPDFIRGYFDGNGLIEDISSNRISMVFICKYDNFINRLFEILCQEAAVEGGSFNRPSLMLKFNKKDSIKVGKYIYKNNPELFLLRKKEKIDKYIKEEK